MITSVLSIRIIIGFFDDQSGQKQNDEKENEDEKIKHWNTPDH
jgi:hypothetical protein